MLRNLVTISTVFLIALLSGCQALPNQTVSSTNKDLEYRIELLEVKKRLRSGTAVFQLMKRHTSDPNKEWKVAPNDSLILAHIGDELAIDSPKRIETNDIAIATFQVQLKDPLKYFKGVKPSSYPVTSEFRSFIMEDVDITTPYTKSKPWEGWENAKVDPKYLIQLTKGELTFWLPISYKDIRPLLKNLAYAIHRKRISALTLNLIDNEGSPIEGVDIFISGTTPLTKSLVENASSSQLATEYLIDVFPSYLTAKDGGYDQTKYYVLPGDYLLEVIDGDHSWHRNISIPKNKSTKLDRHEIIKSVIITRE